MVTNNKFEAELNRIDAGRLGAYDIKVHIPCGHIRKSADGKKYIIAHVEGTLEKPVYIDELIVRPKVRMEVWIDINAKRANFIRNRKAIRAALMNSPILI